MTEELRSCPVPILYLQAAGDLVIRPRNAELVRSLREDAEVVVLPGPHLVLQASPREAAAALTVFCERLMMPGTRECPPATGSWQ